MNQGSVEGFQKYNGFWQDGGILLHLPSEDRWVAVFLAFQSPCWHTDDEKGNCIGDEDQPAEDKGVVIIAATVTRPVMILDWKGCCCSIPWRRR